MGRGHHWLYRVLHFSALGFDLGRATMIYVVIHPTTDSFIFSGAYSNLRAAQKCADEADFYQGEVFAIDMNEVQDTYEEIKNA